MSKKLKLAYIVITYDKLEHAKLQIESIRNSWQDDKRIESMYIAHIYNGSQDFKGFGLEDTLIKTHNPGHYEGASNMIDLGVDHILNLKSDFDLLLVASADVYFVKPSLVIDRLFDMIIKDKKICTTIWSLMPFCLATEFFAITPDCAKSVFPLRYSSHYNHKETLRFQQDGYPAVEKLMYEKYLESQNENGLQALTNGIYLLPGRRLHYPLNRYFSKGLGYISLHDLERKKMLINKWSQ